MTTIDRHIIDELPDGRLWCLTENTEASWCSDRNPIRQRKGERRNLERRHADIARHVTEQAVLVCAMTWRSSEAGDKRTAAALRLRDAVDALLDLDARNLLGVEQLPVAQAGDRCIVCSRTATVILTVDGERCPSCDQHAVSVERGAVSTSVLVGVAASGATLLFWYGPGTWLAILGAWVGAIACICLAWRHWHSTETLAEHVYGSCRRCNTFPIDCPTARRLADREAGR